MIELLQKLLAFKYSCKLNHWKAEKYSDHLLYDRLQEDLDDVIDDVAEKYYMAGNKKAELSSEVLQPNLIKQDLNVCADSVINHVEKLLSSGEYSEGINSLLGGIAENFTEKKALLSMS